jgi:hypothetical protein
VADPDLGLIAVLVVAGFFLVWYYGAFLYSRRLAARVARELKAAVLRLGGTSSIRWFGTTAFRMKTVGADPPFKEFSVTVTLRPREMPINWALATAQRRRDSAVVEAALRKDPKVEFELVDPRTRLGKRRQRAKSEWSPLSLDGRSLLLAADDEGRVQRLLESLGPGTLAPVMGLHVTAGTAPGIAASVSVEPGRAAQGIAAIRTLGVRLTD